MRPTICLAVVVSVLYISFNLYSFTDSDATVTAQGKESVTSNILRFLRSRDGRAGDGGSPYHSLASTLASVLLDSDTSSLSSSNEVAQKTQEIFSKAGMLSPHPNPVVLGSELDANVAELDTLPRDPNPPHDALSHEGHDPFAESIEYFDSGDGIVFNWTKENVDVQDASTLLAGEAPLGSIIPGRVTKDGTPMSYLRVGNSPLLLVCIHTATTPWSKYMRNWAPSRRVCHSPTCRDDQIVRNMQAITDEQWATLSSEELSKLFLNHVQVSNNTFNHASMPLGDNSGPMCEGIYDYIVEKTNKTMYPHLVYTGVPKAYLDHNRNPRHFIFPRGRLRSKYNMTAQNPELIASRDDFFGFVREAKNVIARSYGYGWIFSMHSQFSVGNRCDVGGGWEAPLKSLFNNPDLTLKSVQPYEVPTRNSEILLMFDSISRGLSPYEAVFGESSVSEILTLRGLGSAPSRAHQYDHGKKEGCFCNGAAFANRVAMPSKEWADGRQQLFFNREIKNRPKESWFVGNFNSAIVEFHARTTDLNTSLGQQTLQVWGETLIDIAVDHWKLPVQRPNGRIFKSLQTTYESIMGGRSCQKGKLIRTNTLSKNYLSITVEKCVEICNSLDGCKYIEMSVDPLARRYCSYYSSCKAFPVTRYRNVVNIDLYNAGV